MDEESRDAIHADAGVERPDDYPPDVPFLPGTTVVFQLEQTMWIVTAPDLAARIERLGEATEAWQDDPRVAPLWDLAGTG